MVVGIDIDDTISDTSLSAAKYLTKYNNKVLDYHNLSLEDYDEFAKLYIENIMSEAPLKEGVKEAFEYLHNKEYTIIIITARNLKYSDNIYDITKEYLKTNRLKYDKILFDREKKGLDANNLGVDIFIDDKERVLDDVSKYGIDCIRITRDKNSKHKTFINWFDIIKYIDGKEG
ncbi:MAG: hypothetical protein E7163_01460 [Firmicutes bacterium]|nr:hypothetical protein [Bacillota bacterium]